MKKQSKIHVESITILLDPPWVAEAELLGREISEQGSIPRLYAKGNLVFSAVDAKSTVTNEFKGGGE